MEDEKRNNEKAIPDNAEEYLNALQQAILVTIKKYSWTLKFIRRAHDEAPTIVIEDKEGQQIGVLEDNGAINYDSGIVIRVNE